MDIVVGIVGVSVDKKKTAKSVRKDDLIVELAIIAILLTFSLEQYF